MKIQDRMKQLDGITDSYWDASQSRLVVYYQNISLNCAKTRVSGAIGEAGLQRAVDKITFIEVSC